MIRAIKDLDSPRPRYGVSHAAMILRLGIEALNEGTGEDEKIAGTAAIATLAALFNGEDDTNGRHRYAGLTPREIYEIEYFDRKGASDNV